MKLPYRIATLCFLFDRNGQTLLIHRHKSPNHDLYSPIGGKLEQDDGESPTGCAAREIFEEAGLTVSVDDLHLTGIVSEKGYEGQGHWLLFCYELMIPCNVEAKQISEGRLEWVPLENVLDLPIPDSDRQVIWPLFLEYRHGFFAAHIDCTGPDLQWSLEQSVLPPQ
ncbi:MAG: NUDIX domain-containing protein [Planctomycetes bacterium]|nr:NUDIX domain-containing protein [Planctomycetota bacterium]